MIRILLLVLILTSLFGNYNDIYARKTGYRFKTTSTSGSNYDLKGRAALTMLENTPDSITICKYLPGAIFNSKELDKVILTGFDKKRNNSKESFFIINNTESPLSGIAIEIEYQTPDKRMLTKRCAIIAISIPAGETRKVDIPAWDTQRSFYYFKSDPDPSRGNPFDVVMTTLAISHDLVEAHDGE